MISVEQYYKRIAEENMINSRFPVLTTTGRIMKYENSIGSFNYYISTNYESLYLFPAEFRLPMIAKQKYVGTYNVSNINMPGEDNTTDIKNIFYLILPKSGKKIIFYQKYFRLLQQDFIVLVHDESYNYTTVETNSFSVTRSDNGIIGNVNKLQIYACFPVLDFIRCFNNIVIKDGDDEPILFTGKEQLFQSFHVTVLRPNISYTSPILPRFDVQNQPTDKSNQVIDSVTNPENIASLISKPANITIRKKMPKQERKPVVLEPFVKSIYNENYPVKVLRDFANRQYYANTNNNVNTNTDMEIEPIISSDDDLEITSQQPNTQQPNTQQRLASSQDLRETKFPEQNTLLPTNPEFNNIQLKRLPKK